MRSRLKMHYGLTAVLLFAFAASACSDRSRPVLPESQLRPLSLVSTGPGSAIEVTGSIYSLITGGFTLYTGTHYGYLHVYTNASTQFVGALPARGEQVDVVGTGSVQTSITASKVTQIGSTPAPSPSPAPSASPAAGTIPFWQSSFAYGGRTYSYKMVGSNPMTGGTSTTIANEVIPVRLAFSDGTIFDAGSAATSLPPSPLYVNASYAAGSTQYIDALMRSEFWKYAATKN